MKVFERVAVIGVGLIGGSFALALKAARASDHVVGAGRDANHLALARDLGIVDSVATDPADAVSGADLVLVAAPVAQFARIFAAIAPRLRADAALTDAGSTKRDVVGAARANLGSKLARYVPAHPVAGSEHSGAAAARADLFKGKTVVLAPLEEGAADALERIEQAWGACGARLARMTPETHDEVFAAVSHLPHVLAYALVQEIAARPDADRLFAHAAGGFRDFTRIASSHPEMWRDICLANRDALLDNLDRYAAQLAALRSLIERGDAESLERLFAAAREARGRWLSGDYEP
ncbi:MAG: prephenate dehydrogenase [Betaproteobacteria bacterium RIFCSPLOWO2_02_FULL_67_19]|nr:MAG: prephenate dehydrogenase [Betaproteobacteria bacterium RIFCSPLOWO2_02_FULL_67_19]